MTNKNEMIMKLFNKFKRNFRINSIISVLITILLFIVNLMIFREFVQGDEKFWNFMLLLLIFIIMVVVTMIVIIPFIKDIKHIKMGKVKKITGTVIKYRKVVHGGDPTTYSYHPIVRDINNNSTEVELITDDTELNKVYYCVYLPNTKLAVCEEVKNLNDNT